MIPPESVLDTTLEFCDRLAASKKNPCEDDRDVELSVSHQLSNAKTNMSSVDLHWLGHDMSSPIQRVSIQRANAHRSLYECEFENILRSSNSSLLWSGIYNEDKPRVCTSTDKVEVFMECIRDWEIQHDDKLSLGHFV